MVERADLAEELDRLAAEDLAVRQRLVEAGELYGHYNSEMREVHRRNGDRLTAILDEVGTWPGHRLVGADGSKAALLIAQHDESAPRRSVAEVLDERRRGEEFARESGWRGGGGEADRPR